MAIVSILATFVFSTVLCIIVIPQMRKEKLNKELWTFSILLGLGIVIAILKGFKLKIPNPADFVTWVYSPLIDPIKSLLK